MSKPTRPKNISLLTWTGKILPKTYTITTITLLPCSMSNMLAAFVVLCTLANKYSTFKIPYNTTACLFRVKLKLDHDTEMP